MKKRWNLWIVTFAIVFVIAVLTGNPRASIGQTTQSPQEIAISTASSGGAWFPIGAGMAEVIKKSVPGVQARVQTTGGGVENVKLVHDGKTEVGTMFSYLAYPASSRYSLVLEAPTFLSRRLPTILPHS